MKEIIGHFRRYIFHIGMLSFVIDILMLTPPMFMLGVLDKVITGGSNETLLVLFALALYAVFLMSLLDNFRNRLLHRFGATFKVKIAPQLLALNLNRMQQSETTRHALEDVEVLESFLTGNGIKAFFELPWIPILIIVLYLFHPALAATAVVLAALLLVLTFIEDRLTAPHQKRAVELSRRTAAFALTARRNVEAVGSLGMQDAVTERWNKLNAEYLYHGGRAARTSATIQGMSKFIRVAGQMTSLAVGAWLLLNFQEVTRGIMVAALIIMGRTLAPIDHAIGAWRSFVSARAAYGRLQKLITETEAERLPTVDLPRPNGHLAVERLYLQFGPGQRILSGINFKLPAGESLGVIGPSGSGKTTLVRLIVGLIRPTQGHVRLDGAEVYQWAQSGLGQYVGYLPQEAVIFPGTIAENIARMKDPELHTDAIIAAAKKARVHEMILKMPKGYGTEVGEGGSRLSGGQRQLVGLARALFGNPSLLVLDEPNANLDGSAEIALSEVIRGLKVSRVTIVVVAHKPSMISDMDRLLVLQNGEQRMYGSVDDVLRQLNTDRMLEGPSGMRTTVAGQSASPEN